MSQRGFTLVELMITLVLMAILLSLGLPSFSTFIVSQRAKGAAFDLESSIYMARSEAIKRGRTVTLAKADAAPSGDWSQGWTVQTVLDDGTTVVLQQQGAYQRIVISGLAGDTGTTALDSLAYGIDGRAAGGAGRFSIAADDPNATERCVRIGTSGMPATKVRMTGACS